MQCENEEDRKQDMIKVDVCPGCEKRPGVKKFLNGNFYCAECTVRLRSARHIL